MIVGEERIRFMHLGASLVFVALVVSVIVVAVQGGVGEEMLVGYIFLVARIKRVYDLSQFLRFYCNA